MRNQLVLIALLIGCRSVTDDGDLADAARAHQSITTDDPRRQIFDEVDGDRITQRMREMSGVAPVVVDGQTITLGERFSSDGRKNFRNYWTQVMRGFGLEITPFHYQAAGHPRGGDNIEAVLRGR